MIEKLKPNEDKVFKTETGEYLTIPELGVPKPISDKINELVDVVNKQQDIIRQIGEWGSSKGECLWCENITAFANKDLYAEQKRWIGKLCRFWNMSDKDDCSFGILEEVNGKHRPYEDCDYIVPYKDDLSVWFEHCEPILPNDEIVYKKGE